MLSLEFACEISSANRTSLNGVSEILAPENLRSRSFEVRSGSREVRSGFVRGPFGFRAESARGPFGIRSGSVRDPFEGCTGFVRSPFGIRNRRSRKITTAQGGLRVPPPPPNGRYGYLFSGAKISWSQNLRNAMNSASPECTPVFIQAWKSPKTFWF